MECWSAGVLGCWGAGLCVSTHTEGNTIARHCKTDCGIYATVLQVSNSVTYRQQGRGGL